MVLGFYRCFGRLGFSKGRLSSLARIERWTDGANLDKSQEEFRLQRRLRRFILAWQAVGVLYNLVYFIYRFYLGVLSSLSKNPTVGTHSAPLPRRFYHDAPGNHHQ